MIEKETEWSYPLEMLGNSLELEKTQELEKWVEEQVSRMREPMEEVKAKFVDFTFDDDKFTFHYNIGSENEKSWAISDINIGGCLGIGGKNVNVLQEKNDLFVEVAIAKRLLINPKNLFEEGLADAEKHPLQAVLGEGENGEAVTLDISRHSLILIGGLIGSGKGKRGGLYSLITSIMAHNSPDQVEFAILDSMYDFSPFKDSPFLSTYLATEVSEEDVNNVVPFLEWVCKEKQRRLDMLSQYGRDINEFNKCIDKGEIIAEKIKPLIIVIEERTALGLQMTGDKMAYEKKGHIEFIVEEGFIMMERRVEEGGFIKEIGALDSKDVGIHLILPMVRPSVKMMRDLQNSITCRWVFYTGSKKYDLELGVQGAEKLEGYGDSYLYQEGDDKPTRLLAPIITYEAGEDITRYLLSNVE